MGPLTIDAELRFPLEWKGTATRFYGRAGVIGFTFASGPDVDIWLGAKHREHIEPLAQLLEDWPDLGF